MKKKLTEQQLDIYLDNYRNIQKLIQLNILEDLQNVYTYEYINNIIRTDGYFGVKYLYYEHFILEKVNKYVVN